MITWCLWKSNSRAWAADAVFFSHEIVNAAGTEMASLSIRFLVGRRITPRLSYSITTRRWRTSKAANLEGDEPPSVMVSWTRVGPWLP
jgi:hypothetical protein